MRINDLAPIGITTYTRLSHLTKTIESLQKNKLAAYSDLYIFSDAPREGDEAGVEKIRRYINTIDGFKKVHLVERLDNGALTNALDGIEFLLKSHGRMIWMEDDNIVSEFFLDFMNYALEIFKDDGRIVAISAFNTPMKYSSDAQPPCYLSKYFSAWGYATWENRGFLDIVNHKDAYLELQDAGLRKKISSVHPNLHLGLKQIYEDQRLYAGDYSLVFHAIKNNQYFIKPFHSLVKNIGHDGSGMNCGVAVDKFDIEPYGQPVSLDRVTELRYKPIYDKEYYKYFHRTRMSRVLSKAKNLLAKLRMLSAGQK